MCKDLNANAKRGMEVIVWNGQGMWEKSIEVRGLIQGVKRVLMG